MKPSSKTVSNRSKLLILAGLDPTGNAGLIRDMNVAKHLRVPHLGFPTAITMQSDSKYVGTQFFEDTYFKKISHQIQNEPIHAIKIGMLGNEETVRAIINLVAQTMRRSNPPSIIWDPVLHSTSGGQLLTPEGLKLALQELLPLTRLVTPNFEEIHKLLGILPLHTNTPSDLLQLWHSRFHTPLYLKGGHTKSKSTDYYCDGEYMKVLKGKTTKRQLRGTGCTFSTAVAVYLLRGKSLRGACISSKNLLQGLFDGHILNESSLD